MTQFGKLHLFGLLGATLWLVLAAVGVFAADEAKPAAKPAPAVTPEQAQFFESKIRPLLIGHCYTCHSDQAQRGGLRLDSPEALRKGNVHGPALVPGDPDRSPLIRAVGYEGAVKMPPAGKLRPEEIAALTAWVQMGAPWPDARQMPGTPNPAQAPDYVITPAQKTFWAFQPVKKPALPPVKDAAWARTPIDRFLLAKLEAKGLKPAPPADRRTLIRRVTFDLIGLPPTPEEVEAFVNDRAPDAWAKVVDRLLASPHYGERWGRHWLDVVRYSDSNGLDENVAFANAWRYRDYVIAAFNQDKPYDVFVQEQLAGDLMPTDDLARRNERITATGFLTLGAKVLAEPDKAKLAMDIVDEQIEVTSKAFLGLTVACARCHNHKFDPIPTKDYYALAGIFKSTRSMASLATVAMWEERPLADPSFAAKQAAYATTLKGFEDALKAEKAKADTELAARFRKDLGKYLLAGWELAQQPSTEMEAVADTPAQPGDPPRMIVEAENYARGNANKNFDTYGKGIGVIHTVTVPTFAEWDLTVPEAGNYQLDLRYAALESRPVRLLLNGQVIREDAAGSVTGSWNPEGQRWEPQGIFAFRAGKNTLRLERDGSIPHVDKLLLVRRDLPRVYPHVPSPRLAEQLAAQHSLSPDLLKQVARYLRGQKDRPEFAGWQALREVPEDRFDAEADRLAQHVLQGNTGDSARIQAVLQAPTGPLALTDRPERYYTESAKAAIRKAEQALKTAQANAPRPPMAMAVDEGLIENVRVHIRGDTQNLGDTVPRHFLTVLGGDRETGIDDKHSGRLELARWLTRPDHPLTSRVAVNRIWQHHFGEGLVRTPDNFGLLGERPTHPELLDWLAATFVEQGWSIKKLHRLILLSNAYQMACVADPQTTAKAMRLDPDNTLLWKMSRRRLEVEPFRDAILAVSGRLDLTLGGSLLNTQNHDYVTNDQSANAARYDTPRRSVYLPIIRNALFGMFQAFDMGDPSMVNARRATTTVAPQALYLLNSPFLIEQSRAFAAELLHWPAASDAERIQRAYLLAYARPPSAAELARSRRYLASYADVLAPTEPDPAKRQQAAWASLCHLLFASNEFIYLD